ncbi:hypothetical protein [Catenovulum sediminis]|uniref:Methyltransferase type 11 domain-containing protein n=1 Tax=Catenovulum sediminis TaxID=1740262 RepID=A0ABV1RH24_9ALTE
MKPYIVFGVGQWTDDIINRNLVKLEDITAFSVTKPQTSIHLNYNKPIVPLDNLSQYSQSHFFVIASESYKQIFVSLLERGVAASNVFAFLPHFNCLAPLAKQTIGMCLNIGGGYNFYHSDWINLESSSSYLYPFQLTPNCKFPIPEGQIGLLYSSHNFEHLNDETLSNILNESFRVCSHGAKFILKLPDFEAVVDAWKQSNQEYFSRGWGFESLLDNWKFHNIEDTVANRALMIFCGISLKESAKIFERDIDWDAPGYIGPVPLADEEVDILMEETSANKISSRLVEKAKRLYPECEFIHQNAWFSFEVINMIESVGFKFVTMEKDQIIDEFSQIPDVKKSYEISRYYYFAKP